MKSFYIIARSFGEQHIKYVNFVKDYLSSRGAVCDVDTQTCTDESDDKIDLQKDYDCVITVGGDGTVVRVAQNLSNTDVPIVGLNCGHLGYLCDMSTDNVEHCLDMLLSDNTRIDERMMLDGILDDDELNSYTALNDIVISSAAAGIAVLNLKVSVNGIQLYSHNCDGLILATPTGSTAYNLSANGPIVSPHSDCIILTPINPHTLNSRSIILSSDDEIQIEVGLRHFDDTEEATVIYDGVSRQILHKGEVLKVTRSKATTKMVRLESANFLERIRARMQEI